MEVVNYDFLPLHQFPACILGIFYLFEFFQKKRFVSRLHQTQNDSLFNIMSDFKSHNRPHKLQQGTEMYVKCIVFIELRDLQ